MEQGDIMRIPAGTPVYLINRDENEKLCIVKILQPVSVPGHFEVSNMSQQHDKCGSFSMTIKPWFSSVKR